MPTLGEIKRRQHHPHIWAACTSCGKERWIRLVNGTPRSARCHSCGPSPHQPSHGKGNHTGIPCPVCSMPWRHKQHAEHMAKAHPEYAFTVVHQKGNTNYLCAICSHTLNSLIGLPTHYACCHPSAIGQAPLQVAGDNHQESVEIEPSAEQILKALRYMIDDRDSLIAKVTSPAEVEAQNTELLKVRDGLQERIAELERLNRETAESLRQCEITNTNLLDKVTAPYRFRINQEMHAQSLENTGR